MAYQKKILSLKFYVLHEGEDYRDKLEKIKAKLSHAKGMECEVELVNLSQRPEEAEAQEILAIPTLIREMPAPTLRLIGNIEDIEGVVNILSRI